MLAEPFSETGQGLRRSTTLDPLTIKEVGGWKTLAMVQRYTHLAPGHLHAAVERVVPHQQEGAVELARN